MSPAVQAYQDEIVNGALAGCIAKSKEIGGIVEQHVSHDQSAASGYQSTLRLRHSLYLNRERRSKLC